MAGKLDGATILVVEDEFLILLDLEYILTSEGAAITTATSLKEAVSAADAHYDVAVLDVRLPDGEVFPAAHKLDARDVPIVFHSGHAQTDDITKAFPSAIALEKPAREQMLVAALEQQIAGGRMN